MSELLTALRVFSTLVGVVVILMWLAGAFGLADFILIFRAVQTT